MTFVVNRRISSAPGATVRQASRRIAGRLRHLRTPLAMSPQQRAERYVAHMPTAVLGAC